MDVTSHIEALVAALELNEVRLLREAMRVVVPAGRVEARAQGRADVYEACRRDRCEQACYQPQVARRIAPSASSTHQAAQDASRDRTGSCAATPQAAEPPPSTSYPPSAIQPPWKVLPWNTAVEPVVQLKRNIVRPDIIMSNRGAILDLFI